MKRKQCILISLLVLLISLGLFMYHIVQLNEQGITGYIFRANIEDNIESLTLLFVIISIILSVFALAFSTQIPQDKKIKQLINNVSVALNNNETSAARMMYVQLRNNFKKLPKNDKEKHHAKCMQLYQRLVNQVMVR